MIDTVSGKHITICLPDNVSIIFSVELHKVFNKVIENIYKFILYNSRNMNR